MATTLEIADALTRIEAVYRARAPIVLSRTVTPATAETIDALEAVIGEALPPDYRTFLLLNRVAHNFPGNFECLSVDRVMACWSRMTKALDAGVFDDGRIEHHEAEGFGNWSGDRLKKVWWSSKWVPVSEDSCANMFCIDCDPGPGGVKYQILNMEVQDGQGPFASRFTSFSEYLSRFVDALEAGRFVVDDWGISVD